MIPPGQPILVGHHSERRARRDAQRIENGMKRAVMLFERAEYWEERARSALLHAKYKERPDVRWRRIKKIEADLRKAEKTIAQSQKYLTMWRAFFRCLNGSRRISLSDLRFFMPSLTAEELRGNRSQVAVCRRCAD